MYQFNAENEISPNDAFKNTEDHNLSNIVISSNDNEVSHEILDSGKVETHSGNAFSLEVEQLEGSTSVNSVDLAQQLGKLPSDLAQAVAYINRPLISMPELQRAEIKEVDIVKVLVKILSGLFNKSRGNDHKRDELFPHMLAIANYCNQYLEVNSDDRPHFNDLDMLLYHIGACYFRQGHYNEAFVFFNDALLQIEILGVDRSSLEWRKQLHVDILQRLGASCYKNADIKKAIFWVNKALKSCESHFGYSSYRQVVILINLADIYKNDSSVEIKINRMKRKGFLEKARKIQERGDSPYANLLPIIISKLKDIDNENLESNTKVEKLPQWKPEIKNNLYFEEQRKKEQINNNKRALDDEDKDKALPNKSLKLLKDDEISRSLKIERKQ